MRRSFDVHFGLRRVPHAGLAQLKAQAQAAFAGREGERRDVLKVRCDIYVGGGIMIGRPCGAVREATTARGGLWWWVGKMGEMSLLRS